MKVLRTESWVPPARPTRRQMILGGAFAFGALVAARAGAQTTAAAVAPDPSRTSLHYQADFKGGAQRLYEVLLDSRQFASLTGRAATIDPTEGGAFSLFGAVIVGRNIELVPGQRIVQAWRPAYWEPGFFSVVRFQLHGLETGVTLVLDHTGFPVGDADSLDSGWKSHYLDPLAKYLA